MQCIKDTIKNINIVIGCGIGCPYCYAKINNDRFKAVPDFSNPVFFPSKLKMLDNKKHRAYMLTGQSDLSGWRQEWTDAVFERMNQNPDTRYIFLTKRPESIHLDRTPDNGWFGVTVTAKSEKSRIKRLRDNIKAKNYHVTFEPLFEDVGEIDFEGISWVVVGTETGSRKGKSVSQRRWVDSIVSQASAKNIPVFMKEDLLGIYSREEMIQQFPEEFYRL